MTRTVPMLLFVSILVLASGQAGGQPPGPVPEKPVSERWTMLVSAGRRQLDAGHYQKARSAFRGAATAAADSAEKARALFYLALVEEADGQPSRAAVLYRKALQSDPRLAAAANNLAQILAAQGKTDEALRFQTIAAETDDPRQPFYRRNLAALYAARGDTQRAIREYVIVLKTQPGDLEAEKALVQLYDGEAAAAYLSGMVANGAVDRAQQYAMEKIARTDSSRAKRDLLEIVAVTLARQQVNAETFPKHPVASGLQSLASDPSVAPGVRELRAAFTGEPGDVGWWAQGDSSKAYGALIREIALHDRVAGRHEVAERRLLEAVDVTQGEDPDVVLALAELYYEQERIPKIDELLAQYGDRLFSGKSAAYLRGDWSAIYRFHVALGTMYSVVGKVGSASDPRSAIFQLERAQTAARENNRNAAVAPIYVDPPLVERLAVSYEKAARPDDAARVRLTAAEGYMKQGRTLAAQETVAPVDKGREKLAPGDARRYDELQKVLPKASSIRDANVVVKPPQ